MNVISKSRKLSSHEVYTAQTVWGKFDHDLTNSLMFRLRIQCPFLTFRRIEYFARTFEKLIERRVIICVFIQEPYSAFPQAKDPNSLAQRKTLIDRLVDMGYCPALVKQ